MNVDINIVVSEGNLTATFDAFERAGTTLYIVPSRERPATEAWGPVMMQVTTVHRGTLHGWHVDGDGMALHRVAIPVAEIGTVEVVS